MITLRQLEALFWIVELGTFERAANRLSTTQSAISKRIQELEASTGLTIFDRSQRGARLTEHGEQILALCRQMMELHDRIQMLKQGEPAPVRRLRIGVTELSALTWLPRLVAALRRDFPEVHIEPEVDLSRNLYERLLENDIDIIVIPENFTFPDITGVKIGDVRNVWMARPGLVETDEILSLSDLSLHPILTQGRRSGTGIFISNWLKAQGASFPRTLSCDNMIAQLAFAIAGLGVGYFPRDCLQPLLAEGKLVVIDTRPALPAVPYVAMFRSERRSFFLESVAELIRNVCDFSRQLQI